ncbi:MAG: GNAT family N-acetyltransferase [Actinomycetia bacterium]|nr:GNAT family N-acetyltransferase [Actinomycetes bacterium]
MIKIRKASLKDLEIIMEIWEEFNRTHKEKLLKKNSRYEEFFTMKSNAFDMVREYVKQLIKSKKSIIHLVEDKGTVIAYNNLEIKKGIPIYKNEEFGYISDLFVKKEYRGEKISSKLYLEAQKWFKKKGIKYITIGVNPENEKALLLYKHWGFFDFRIEMRNKI